jgi:GNAT superfamily N-acetyltransferase
MSSDSDSEDLTSDVESHLSDWEDYVDLYSNLEWLEMIHGKVTLQQDHCSQETQIAECKAILIRRRPIAYSFWDDMERPELQTAELAFELFDRYGCLQPKFKNHHLKRGCGVWNDELNDGDILLILGIRVTQPNRLKGIGSKLVRAILELTAKKSEHFFALAAPELFIDDFEGIENEGSKNGADDELLAHAALRFWRRLDFRRIGSSRWLGWTPDQSHPSHAVAPNRDFDLPSPQKVSFTSEMEDLVKALPKIEDTECLTRLKRIFHGIPFSDTRWEARVDDGNTFLHLVSCSSKIQSTRWLMHSNPNLCHALNACGRGNGTKTGDSLVLCSTHRYIRSIFGIRSCYNLLLCYSQWT